MVNGYPKKDSLVEEKDLQLRGKIPLSRKITRRRDVIGVFNVGSQRGVENKKKTEPPKD